MLTKHFIYLDFILLGFILFTSVRGDAAEVNAFKTPENISQENTHIRALAASCAACHGTNGNSVTGSNAGSLPVLAGLNANYFSSQMNAFKNGERVSTVMHHHAKGLHADEIDLLALYFSQQKRITATPLKAQTLKTNHD